VLKVHLQLLKRWNVSYANPHQLVLQSQLTTLGLMLNMKEATCLGLITMSCSREVV